MSSPRTTSGKSSRAASRWRKRCGMPEAGMSDTDMNGGPSFLTTREVAALLRVKERKVYDLAARSEEHTSELQSLMRISYAVFCLKKKTRSTNTIDMTKT